MSIEQGETFEKTYIDKYLLMLNPPGMSPNDFYDNYIEDNLAQLIIYGKEEKARYIIEPLIDIVNQAPEDINQDTDSNAIVRTRALRILKETYSVTHPSLGEASIDSLIARRLKFDKDAPYTASSDEEQSYKRAEIYEIRDFFRKIVHDTYSDKTTLKKVFYGLTAGNGLADFNQSVEESQMIKHILIRSGNFHNSFDLFQDYIDILTEREDNLKYDDESDYPALHSITCTYETILSLDQYPHYKEMSEINRTLFTRIINNIKNNPDNRIRNEYFWPLESIIKREDQQNENWRKQQLEMEREILKTLSSTSKEPFSEVEFHEIIHTVAYNSANILLQMLEKHTSEGIYKTKEYQNMPQDYKDEYKNAFNIVMETILNNDVLKSDKLGLLDKVEKIIGLKLLNNPNHPFLLEGRRFLHEYYKNPLE